MAAPMKTGLPLDCELSAGYVVRLTALHPTTGALVSGVQLSNVSFFVSDLRNTVGTTGPDNTPVPLLVPSDELV